MTYLLASLITRQVTRRVAVLGGRRWWILGNTNVTNSWLASDSGGSALGHNSKRLRASVPEVVRT